MNKCALDDIDKIYIKAGKAQEFLNCEICNGVNHPVEKPKIRKWVCEDCGHSKMEVVE